MNRTTKSVFVATVLSISFAAVSATAAEENRSTERAAREASKESGVFDEQRMKQHNDQMEAHLKEMQALMQRIRETKDPQARQRLMKEHHAQMQALHKQMRSTRDDMRMGIMGGGMRRGGSLPEGEKMRQHLIEKRLDMMDLMMDMMMQREDLK